MEKKYQLLEKGKSYDSSDSKFLCLNCKKDFFTSLHNVSRKNLKVCPFCEVITKNATKEQIEFKLELAKEDYTILEFNGFSKKNSLVRHNKCGKISETNLARILRKHNGKCPQCSHGHIAYSSEYVKNEIYQLTNGEYEVISNYQSEEKPILIKHKKCGTVWKCRRRNFVLRNNRCPICWRFLRKSKGEKLIEKILSNNKTSFEREKIFSDCKNKRSLPFDFYIEDLNLLIEFDGEMHFHKRRSEISPEKLRNTHKNDLIKNQYCKENNINLLRISYILKNNEIILIIEELLKNKEISSTTIAKYSSYFYYNNLNKGYYNLYNENAKSK